MAFSTQTTTLKPSSYFWFSRYSYSLPYLPLLPSSAKPLYRGRACILRQASNYNSMAVGQRNSCEDTKYDSSSEWELEVRFDSKNPTSYASMLRRQPNRSNYPQREEKQQPRFPMNSHNPPNLTTARSNIYMQSPRNSCEDTKYDSSTEWKLKAHLDSRNPASHASMLRGQPNRTNYAQREEKQLPRFPINSHNPSNLTTARSNIYMQSPGDQWLECADSIRKMKEESCSATASSNHAVQYVTEYEVIDRTNSHNGSIQETHLEEKKETNHRIEESKSIQKNAAKQKSVDDISRSVAVAKNAANVARERLNQIFDKVLLVDNISIAKDIVGKLTNQYRNLVHACDTEVANIDVKQETPVDHGEIICFSIYSGSEANFGDGKSCIWVDVLSGGGRDILAMFAPFFEDPDIKKVWHNYSFDNHVIENYGLKLSGFHADTMHMARLWDSSRRTEGGYSLEALTCDPAVMSGANLSGDEKLIGKVSMKTIFGKRKLKKDGSEGKVVTIPPVEELQREERKSWVCYSALDSISTLKLYESLKTKLCRMEWELNGVKQKGSMYDFYERYWRPFGELLVKMETEGMLVDRAYLAEIEKIAKAEQQVAAAGFRNWASKYCADARYMNVGSDTQLRQLFFGGIANRKDPNEILPEAKEFKIPNVDKVIEEGKKAPTKFRKIKLHSIVSNIKTELYTASGWPSMSGDALKALAGKITADFDFTDETHQAEELESDENSENTDEMIKDELEPANGRVASNGPDTSAYGTAFSAFGGGSKGIEACHAIFALCQGCSIDSLISNFILPLQGGHISGKNGRIHCSLNINTETGRLSARRPNLQNQPALEKDRYKIRQAFIAAPGNSLIVADYGQLELRILAHLANCKSMLDAFKAGGDFHSRTALNMYPHIRDAVDKKQVLLEWYPQPGEDKPPVPLLKDAFASERRKAKMLNFSIAYGKTATGLARDWKVSVKEAKETVDLWYNERKEVLRWQHDRKKQALAERKVYTLLGRARCFPSTAHATQSQKGHIERAAINTPVQGSAADVAMCAMLEISKNARLKELGWRLLLQVHDEVILEGPTESAEVAKDIVVDCMSKPFDGRNFLSVDLSVDAKCAQNWYSAK